MKFRFYLILLILSACADGNNQDISIAALKEYALSFQSCEALDCMIFDIGKLPEDVEYIIKNRKIDDDFILYNTLILARLYRSHIGVAHQSYIIDRGHPCWKAFKEYSGIPISSEYETSRIVYAWLDTNKEQLNPLLYTEYSAIKAEDEKINSGIYWK